MFEIKCSRRLVGEKKIGIEASSVSPSRLAENEVGSDDPSQSDSGKTDLSREEQSLN